MKRSKKMGQVEKQMTLELIFKIKERIKEKNEEKKARRCYEKGKAEEIDKSQFVCVMR